LSFYPFVPESFHALTEEQQQKIVFDSVSPALHAHTLPCQIAHAAGLRTPADANSLPANSPVAAPPLR
jgi:hypothetical protein